MSRGISCRLDGSPGRMGLVSLGKRVRLARERRGLGVNDLDRAIGTNVGYISRLENDEFGAVGSDKLAKIGEILQVSLDFIIRGIGTLDEALLVEGRRVRDRAGWIDAVTEAQRRHPSMPDRVWEIVGDLTGPDLPMRVDFAFVAGLARQIFDAHASGDQAAPWRTIGENKDSGAMLPVGRPQRGRRGKSSA